MLRRNITKIRISCHNLPIEYLRRFNIDRNERLCNCCDSNNIGSEEHIIIHCTNPQIVEYRDTLFNKLKNITKDFEKLNNCDKLRYLALAIDTNINFYFAIFLDKIYKLVEAKRNQKKCQGNTMSNP